MAQRKPRVEIHASSISPTAGGSAPAKTRRDPLVNAILKEFALDTPGVGHALRRLGIMKDEGQEITLDIARACIQTYVDFHARLIAKEEEKLRRSVVYYMRLGPLVKIGWSTNLEGRKDAINPQEVMATEPGGREVERKRHQQFAHLRVHGEWFNLAPPLTQWIESLGTAEEAEEKDEATVDMIATKKATRLYRVPYSRLRLWAKQGRICEPVRRGRELYWNAEEIEQILNQLGDSNRKRLPRLPPEVAKRSTSTLL